MKKLMLWLRRFVMVYGIIMLGTFFMCLLFNPTSELPVVTFFGRCIIFTFVCMATLIIYYSKNELTTKTWWLRTIAHTVLLEILLLPLAHHWEFWYGRIDAIIYASFILGGKILWHLIDFGRSVHTASEVNERLRRRRQSQIKTKGGETI